MQVQLHFQRRMPLLAREHGAPVQPAVAVQEIAAPPLVDALGLHLLPGGQEQRDDVLLRLLGEGEQAIANSSGHPCSTSRTRPAHWHRRSPATESSGTGPTGTRSGLPSRGRRGSRNPSPAPSVHPARRRQSAAAQGW
ncbi:hypothetical protein G6F57_020573 [Rhizopus arrhizus]|nr:hypothetical protein G6F57_020573 [Rhizopus arrhizus]